MNVLRLSIGICRRAQLLARLPIAELYPWRKTSCKQILPFGNENHTLLPQLRGIFFCWREQFLVALRTERDMITDS
jgi:hypothetical protein